MDRAIVFTYLRPVGHPSLILRHWSLRTGEWLVVKDGTTVPWVLDMWFGI